MGKPFFRYEYKGFGGCDCHCNLEVYGNLAICSERTDNEGTSVTNMAEQLAKAICVEFDITPSKLLWIEHYPATMDGKYEMHAESHSLVFFNLTGGNAFEKDFQFSNPRWVSIEKAVVDALIETHKQVEEPTIEEWDDGKHFDEPYATETEDKV